MYRAKKLVLLCQMGIWCCWDLLLWLSVESQKRGFCLLSQFFVSRSHRINYWMRLCFEPVRGYFSLYLWKEKRLCRIWKVCYGFDLLRLFLEEDLTFWPPLRFIYPSPEGAVYIILEAALCALPLLEDLLVARRVATGFEVKVRLSSTEACS